jgi:hypothetical protein
MRIRKEITGKKPLDRSSHIGVKDIGAPNGIGSAQTYIKCLCALVDTVYLA